jgi:molecular chaperone DnaK
VHVPLIQGESEHGDRNTIVGEIRIDATNIGRDLPSGSEVVVTLNVDEHSSTTAQAYVPLLDQTFSEIVKFGLETRAADAIRQDVKGQRKRLAELERLATSADRPRDAAIDKRVHEIEELL